uniref:GRIP domain-containing protein n=1 Tax=Caenorhabditis tropicalis TaxID=1561998 RepID=A0A1I7TKS0_9PELO
MGRKNKTKLLKYASHSLNASTVGDADGRISSPEGHVPEFEVLTSQLREYVTASPSTSDRNREMKYMFAALEKRDAELVVAKNLIRKLQSGIPTEHSGDGDTSIPINDDSYCDHQQGIVNEELDRIKKDNEELVEEREKLVTELRDTEKNVERLRDEMKTLESNLEKTNKSLEEGRRSSADLVQEMETSLKEAKAETDILQKELTSCRSSFRAAANELEAERKIRVEQDNRIHCYVRSEDEARNKLEQARNDVASANQVVSSLTIEMENQKLAYETSLQQLSLDREKLETRYENINNGIQLMKIDFADVKKNLIQLREENKDLQQQLVATKADVKHYRDDGDACRSYIRKIEAKLHSTIESSEKTIEEARKECDQAQKELNDAKKEVSAYELMVLNLSAELKEDNQTDESCSLLDSIKKLKQSFLLEQRKQVFNLAAVEAKEAAYQKLLQQNNHLLKTINEKEAAWKNELSLFEEEKRKLSEELSTAKITIKKTRKEKDSTIKKLKRLLTENSELAENNKKLEERLGHSASSSSNESVTSQASESLEYLEECISSLKSSLATSEEKLAQVTNQLMEKENENLDLHRTIVAYKSKIHELDEREAENEKTVSTMGSKLAELQRSFNVLQKCYEEDTSKEEADILRTQITKQDVEIERLSSEILTTEQALEKLSQLDLQKSNDYSKSVQSLKTNCEILEKKLEEKTAESSARMTSLKEKEEKFELVKLELDEKANEMREKITRLEIDLAKTISDRNSINSEVTDFKKQVSEKSSELEKLTEEIFRLDQNREQLEKEIQTIKKKFEDSMSPKRDKVLQLENRLEVMQTASKAQCKRLEDEVAAVRTSLKQRTEENQKQLRELQEQSNLASELTITNQVISKELSEAVKLNQTIQSENAEERAGLVNELIDAKQKLGECEKLIGELQDALTSNNSVLVGDDSQLAPERNHIINEMFPSLDPAVRRLVILLSENRNYSYGVLGLVVYGFFIHLYLIFN